MISPHTYCMRKRRLAILAGISILIGSMIAPNQRSGPNYASRAFDVDPHVNLLLQRACADCHSATTRWPWYSHLRPISWLLSHDVQKAREYLDLSSVKTLSTDQKVVIYAIAASHLMPPPDYLMLHPAARLSKMDLAILGHWASQQAENPIK
jgi:hypothetical protein